ncbi:S41 family peptidase [Tenacibaculum xiamenense]|uniref:S41 family peptidase n=1 Tax=Tenacibaculum xiamenense TaxID=1261553 RepID=UPI0038960518
MKQVIVLLSLLSVAIGCKTNKSYTVDSSKYEKILDSIIHNMKENSVYTNNVDWNQLEKEMHNIYNEKDSINTLKSSIKHMLTVLGDFHGSSYVNGEQIKANVKRTRTVAYDYDSDKYIGKMSSIYQKRLKESNSIFSNLIDKSIGYIQIPMILNNMGIDSINIAYTLKIRDKLCKLEKNNPKGYIIDLRTNLGGTMYPMFSGLGILFPNLKLGGDSKDEKTFYSKWAIIEGNMHYEDYAIPNMPAITCNIKLGNRKVAVIIGRYTNSSGEAVASGLKGQKNVKLFGEQTAGASSTISWIPISNNIQLNPTVAYYMSKDGTLNKDGIVPDVNIIEDYYIEKPLQSKAITQAIEWINTSYKNDHK